MIKVTDHVLQFVPVVQVYLFKRSLFTLKKVSVWLLKYKFALLS